MLGMTSLDAPLTDTGWRRIDKRPLQQVSDDYEHDVSRPDLERTVSFLEEPVGLFYFVGKSPRPTWCSSRGQKSFVRRVKLQ